MKKPVKGISLRGLWYYIPWSTFAVCALIAVGGVFYLINADNAREVMETMLDLIEANSTYSDTLTYSQAVWIVMLILVICAFLACAVIAGFRFIQKCITNYKLNEASSYQKTMRFFQAFGFLGALFVMALVAWVALVLGLVGTWYARTEVIIAMSDAAAQRMGQCRRGKACFDTSLMPFWDTDMCFCNSTVLYQLNGHAQDLQGYNRWCFLGLFLMLGGSIFGCGLAAASVGLTTKNRSQLQARHDNYMNKNGKTTAVDITAQSEQGSLPKSTSARTKSAPRLSFYQMSAHGSAKNSTYALRSNSATGSPTGSPPASLRVKPRTASTDMDPTTTDTDLEAGGLVQERRTKKSKSKRSKRSGSRRTTSPVAESAPEDGHNEQGPWQTLDDDLEMSVV